MQYHSHPMHYIRNHESWVQQFSRVYKDFERVEVRFEFDFKKFNYLFRVLFIVAGHDTTIWQFFASFCQLLSRNLHSVPRLCSKLAQWTTTIRVLNSGWDVNQQLKRGPIHLAVNFPAQRWDCFCKVNMFSQVFLVVRIGQWLCWS